MAYDTELADRIRSIVTREPEYAELLSEKEMFGGLAFLIAGNMAVAVSGSGGLMLRCEPSTCEALVDGEHIEPMQMRGRPMSGWLHFDSEALRSDEDLGRYVRFGLAYARGLPSE